MENYIIKPKRLFLLSYFFMGLFMTCLSVLFFIESSKLIEKIVLGQGIIFFGLVTLVFLIKSVKLVPELIVNEKGVFCNKVLVPWSLIEGFSIISFIGNNDLISINLKKDENKTFKISLIGTNLKPKDVLNSLNKYLDFYKAKYTN